MPPLRNSRLRRADGYSSLTMPFYGQPRLHVDASSGSGPLKLNPDLGRRTRLRAPEGGGPREHQRLDHNRHGAGRLEQRPDVDEVEFLEDDPVDRHDRIG